MTKPIKELPMPKKKKPSEPSLETPQVALPQPPAENADPVNTTASLEPVAVIEAPVLEPVFLNIPDPPAPVVPVAPTHGEALVVAAPPKKLPEAKVRIARLNGMTAEEELELIHQAEMEDLHREFSKKLAEANQARAVNVIPKAQAVAPRVAEQTRLEMEAGRRSVQKHADAAARRGPRAPEAPTSVPIFRPEDYIPAITKGQGNVKATSHDVK